MKIRNGFVSNSSTTSFIAIGFFKDKDDITEEELEEALYIEEYEKYVIGKIFSYDDTDPSDHISMDDLIKIIKNIVIKYNINDKDINIVYGSYYN
jgi:hypothetical protein